MSSSPLSSSSQHLLLPQQQEQQKHFKQQSLAAEDFKREQVVFAHSRSRWYTNEEVASILTSFNLHPEWQTNELQIRPKSGAVLLYSREKVRYRQDGYCWKKRKNGRTTREDHMKLKVQGIECIYGSYVHSAILPTFHRRCYWLLQNRDIVLVHYLNQPPDDQNKMVITFNSSLLEADTRRSWTNEEIIEEIGSVFGGISQIQHTLNINFPSTPKAIIHQHQQQQHHPQLQQQQLVEDLDKMIDSSSQSQLSLTNSEVLSDSRQFDATLVDKQQQSSGAAIQIHAEYKKNNGQLDDEDETMTIMSQDDNNNDNIQTRCTNLLDSSTCTGQTSNGQGLRQQNNATTTMMFNCADERHNENQNLGHVVQNVTTNSFGYTMSTNCNNNNRTYVEYQNTDESGMKSTITSPQSELLMAEQTNEQLEQNLCSPVTQIYNKIVDDIETYALPLEPNQFNSDHLHQNLSISLPLQSISITDVERHQQLNQDQLVHVVHREQRHQLISPCDDIIGVGENKSDQRTMLLATCDIFGGDPDQLETTDGDQVENNESVPESLLLNDFNLASNDVEQVNDLSLFWR